MANILDVFNTDAFNMVSLTSAINKAPYVPGRIGELGLFKVQGISTTTAVVEEMSGVLTLIPSKPRGSQSSMAPKSTRKLRSFIIPHLPLDDALFPEDIQNKRQFGTEVTEETVANVTNQKLVALRQQHEVTHEWLKAGALQGLIVDGDGSTTLYNLFTEFGIGETAIDFLLGTATTPIRKLCLQVKRAVEDALGAEPYDHVHALCGKDWFDRFIEHDQVKYAYQLFQEGSRLRDDPRAGFEFGGIIFEEYRGKVGAKPFIPQNVARFFPVGTPNTFDMYFAPADMLNAVNSEGLPFYASQEMMKHQKGVEIHTQSNPLPMCTRPGVLVKGTTSN